MLNAAELEWGVGAARKALRFGNEIIRSALKFEQARRKKSNYGGAEIRFIYITQQII